MENKKTEKSVIWSFVEEHHNFIFFAIVTVLALVARLLMIKYNSGDYDLFLKPWFTSLKVYGGLGGLAYDIGNYTPIYMTILALLTYLPIDSLVSIKIVSIIFDFVGAFALKKIADEFLKGKKNSHNYSLLIYALYLFLPTVLLNSSYWSQSDGIYTAFVLLSILFLIRKSYIKAILFWSIALSFKFQAIFILPLYILMYISERKIKLRYFLITPATIFFLSIPKIIFTRDLLVGFRVYFNQAGTYSQYITLNFPNIYGIFFGNTDNHLIDTPFPELKTIGIIATMLIFIILAYFVYTKKVKFDKTAIIEFGLLSVLVATFFLPLMHERYLFIGDVLALLYIIINAKKYYVPIVIQFISLSGYMYLLFSGFSINFSTLSIVFLGFMAIFTRDICSKYFKM